MPFDADAIVAGELRERPEKLFERNATAVDVGAGEKPGEGVGDVCADAVYVGLVACAGSGEEFDRDEIAITALRQTAGRAADITEFEQDTFREFPLNVNAPTPRDGLGELVFDVADVLAQEGIDAERGTDRLKNAAGEGVIEVSGGEAEVTVVIGRDKSALAEAGLKNAGGAVSGVEGPGAAADDRFAANFRGRPGKAEAGADGGVRRIVDGVLVRAGEQDAARGIKAGDGQGGVGREGIGSPGGGGGSVDRGGIKAYDRAIKAFGGTGFDFVANAEIQG